MAEIINGKQIADDINASTTKEISVLQESGKGRPKLVSLAVGSSEDSEIYVNAQKKAAEVVGIDYNVREVDARISNEDLINEIDKLNNDDTVTAIIVQRPLPDGLKQAEIISRILPEKDAEGIHPHNLGRLLTKEDGIVPCTPAAVMKILSFSDIALYGKEVVIIGHSPIVGKPLSLMMLNETATTTVCHIGTSREGDITSHARRADILVVAVGKPEMVKGDWVSEGTVVIDVGINRIRGKIVGDVNFSEVSQKAALITPVPGGVGPVTVSVLMQNVLRAYRSHNVGTE